MSASFPTSFESFTTKTDNVTDVMAADVNNLQDAVLALEAKVGVDSSAVSGSLDYKVNNFFATGRKLWLYENTAPTGWTHESGITDTVLAVKGGTNSYNVNGGNPDSAATWTMSDGYALTAANMKHGHVWHNYVGAASIATTYNAAGAALNETVALSSGGGLAGGSAGGSGYYPNATFYTGDPYLRTPTEHSHWDSTYRPKASVGIIVSKD